MVVTESSPTRGTQNNLSGTNEQRRRVSEGGTRNSKSTKGLSTPSKPKYKRVEESRLSRDPGQVEGGFRWG